MDLQCPFGNISVGTEVWLGFKTLAYAYNAISSIRALACF